MATITINAADQRTIIKSTPSSNISGIRLSNTGSIGFISFNAGTNLKLVNVTRAILRMTGTMLGGAYPGAQKNVVFQPTFGPYSLNSGQSLSGIIWNNYTNIGVAGQTDKYAQTVTVTGFLAGDYLLSSGAASLDVTGLVKNNLSADGKSTVIMIDNASVFGGSPTDNTYPINQLGLSGFSLEITYSDIDQPAPTPSYPRDIFMNEGSDVLYSWQWNGGAQQTSISLDYRRTGSATWTTVNLSTNAHTYILQGGLSAGSYEWRIKGTNEAGVISPYSEVVTFNVVGKPGAPLIDTPDNRTLTTIKWTSDNQAVYRIALTDAYGNEIVNETISSGASQYKPNVFLKGTYTVSVQYANASGFWSETSYKTFVINPVSPATPSINVIPLRTYNKIEASIPIGTSGAVLRSRNGGEYKVIGLLGESGEYIDNTIESDVVYSYIVRAYADGYSDSIEMTSKNHYAGAIITGNDEEVNLELSIDRYIGLNANYGYDTALTDFSGRGYPMAEKGEAKSEKVQRACFVVPEDLNKLRRLQKVPRCYYRDEYGNAYPCTISGISGSGHMLKGYSITLELVRLADEEVVINV